ncbi:unnamed protein product, partial [Amoebophrya sp. A120]
STGPVGKWRPPGRPGGQAPQGPRSQPPTRRLFPAGQAAGETAAASSSVPAAICSQQAFSARALVDAKKKTRGRRLRGLGGCGFFFRRPVLGAPNWRNPVRGCGGPAFPAFQLAGPPALDAWLAAFRAAAPVVSKRRGKDGLPVGPSNPRGAAPGARPADWLAPPASLRPSGAVLRRP